MDRAPSRRVFCAAALPPAAALLSPGGTELQGADGATVRADFAQTLGTIRALHGINKGPLPAGGLLDLTEPTRRLGVPFTRLHDCHWPNPDVVDMHAVFPDPGADPDRPASYDFRLTDPYLAATAATQARIIYRLGESIEHTSVKRFAHPPRDPERWAQAAVGIIRHVNEGWANGSRLGVRHWEIWNEPDNRPACWTGTDADYFRLYAAAARALKAHDPALLVGGPAVGNVGRFEGDLFLPSPFVTGFLEFCRQESLPLDFFSWHCYTDAPQELVALARAVRSLLDGHGFARTESHLNEWNFLPGNDWGPLSKDAAPPTRARFYRRMAGAEGAAFVAASLIALQDAPVALACLFHGEAGGFGLFSEHGEPNKVYHALHAFRLLLDTPKRVFVTSTGAGVTALVGRNDAGTEARVFVSRTAAGPGRVRLTLSSPPWPTATAYDVRVVDAAHDLTATEVGTLPRTKTLLAFRLDGPGVALVTLRPAAR